MATCRWAWAPTTPWPLSRGARAVVLEVNPNVPFAYGNCHVHISQVAALVESSDPVMEVPLPAIGPVQAAIGSTWPTWWMTAPPCRSATAAFRMLWSCNWWPARPGHTHRDGGRRHHDAGGVRRGDNRRKNYLPGDRGQPSPWGPASSTSFINRNPGFEMHPVDFTNSPHLAGLNDNLVAINATLQIDLLGPVAGSESLAHLPYSGTGGQTDFVRAANRSRGGKAIIVLPPPPRTTAFRASFRVVARHPCQHQQERRQLRGHRVRRGPVAWQIGQAAGA